MEHNLSPLHHPRNSGCSTTCSQIRDMWFWGITFLFSLHHHNACHCGLTCLICANLESTLYIYAVSSCCQNIMENMYAIYRLREGAGHAPYHLPFCLTCQSKTGTSWSIHAPDVSLEWFQWSAKSSTWGEYEEKFGDEDCRMHDNDCRHSLLVKKHNELVNPRTVPYNWHFAPIPQSC